MITDDRLPVAGPTEPPSPPGDGGAPRGGDRMVLGWLAFVVAVAALCAAFWAMKADDGASAGSGAGAASTAAPVEVGLSEFRFAPDMVMLPTGGGLLHLVNNGSAVHNVSIQPSGRTSGDIQPGQSKDLDLTGLDDGTYSMICEIAGHAASGMTGQVMIGGTAGTDSASSATTDTTMSWQDMDAAMAAVAKQFPAATAGHGGDELAPTVLADGTKEFDLTAEIVKWEVAPGKIVDAWTYNGIVPGPAHPRASRATR